MFRRKIDFSRFVGEDPVEVYKRYAEKEFKTPIYREVMPEILRYALEHYPELYKKCLEMTRCPEKHFICAFWVIGESKDKRIANWLYAEITSLGAREKLRVVRESKKLDKVIKALSKRCAPEETGNK